MRRTLPFESTSHTPGVPLLNVTVPAPVASEVAFKSTVASSRSLSAGFKVRFWFFLLTVNKREFEPLKKKPLPLWLAVMVHVLAPAIVTYPFEATEHTPDVPEKLVVPVSLASSGSTSVDAALLNAPSPNVLLPGSGIVMFCALLIRIVRTWSADTADALSVTRTQKR